MTKEDCSPEPRADDEAVKLEAAVLHHSLEIHPARVTIAELARELESHSPSAEAIAAVDRAVESLAAVALLHRHDDFVFPTRAALRAREVLGD